MGNIHQSNGPGQKDAREKKDKAEQGLTEHVGGSQKPLGVTDEGCRLKGIGGKGGERPHESGEQIGLEAWRQYHSLVDQGNDETEQKAPQDIDERCSQGKRVPGHLLDGACQQIPTQSSQASGQSYAQQLDQHGIPYVRTTRFNTGTLPATQAESSDPSCDVSM